jgi:glycosyltransferase 2 family protein
MKHKTPILLLIGLAIMAVMLYFIGIDKVLDALKLANFGFILLAIVAQVITYYLFALRWDIINNTANIHTNVKELIPMVLVGMAINNITPSGRGGGEPVRAYILSKHTQKPSEETFATVIADRALDTFPFLVLAIITIISVMLYFSLSQLIVLILIIAVVVITFVFILLVYMSINQKAGEKITHWIIKIVGFFYKKIEPEELEKKVVKAISGFQKTMKKMLSNKKILYYALPLSFLIWMVEIIRVYLVFMAFGATVDIILIGEVFIVASLIGMIPLLPGGLGAVDGAMILLYSSAGVSPSISAAATVIERLISFWMTTMIGFMILPHYGSSILDKITNISVNEEDTAKEIIDELDYIEDSDEKEESNSKD